MAQANKKVKVASNPSSQHTKKKKKKTNPEMPKKRKKSRNPHGLREVFGTPKDMLVSGVAGLLSAAGTRQIPQMLLNQNNEGAMGYGANLAVTLAITWAAAALAGPAAAKGALVGGSVILLDRAITEHVAPIGKYLKLSGVGDATAISKLGTITTGYFTHPQLQNPDGSMYVPDPYTDQAVKAVMASPGFAQAVAANMPAVPRMGAVNPSSLRTHTASGLLQSSRFASRFN
jgi:hypothetical protein